MFIKSSICTSKHTSKCKYPHSPLSSLKKVQEQRLYLHIFCSTSCVYSWVSVLSGFVSGKVASLVGAVETSCFPACFDQTALHEEKTWLEVGGGKKEERPDIHPQPASKNKRVCSDSLSKYCWWKEEWFHMDTSGLSGLSRNTRVVSDCKIVRRNHLIWSLFNERSLNRGLRK